VPLDKPPFICRYAIPADRETEETVELAISSGRVADIAVDDDYVYWTSSMGFLNGQPYQDSAMKAQAERLPSSPIEPH
jgi:hypothetical protein